MSDTRVSDALFMFATPHHWVCRRCNKHDEVNCYCGYYQGPLKSTEPYSHPKNQPWAIASDALQIARELEQQVESLRAERDALQKIVNEVDDVLIVNWVGPRKDGDYRKALSDLVYLAIQQENDPAISETAAARNAERDALLADKERLDWLDGPNWWDFCRAGNPREPEKDFHLDIGEGEQCETYSAKSAREAIDAARKPVSQEPAK